MITHLGHLWLCYPQKRRHNIRQTSVYLLVDPTSVYIFGCCGGGGYFFSGSFAFFFVGFLWCLFGLWLWWCCWLCLLWWIALWWILLKILKLLLLLLKRILLECVWWHSILAIKRSKLSCEKDIEFVNEGVAGFDEDDEFGACNIPRRLLKNNHLDVETFFVI